MKYMYVKMRTYFVKNLIVLRYNLNSKLSVKTALHVTLQYLV